MRHSRNDILDDYKHIDYKIIIIIIIISISAH